MTELKVEQELLHKQMFDTNGNINVGNLAQMEKIFQSLVKQAPPESKYQVQYKYADYMYQINRRMWYKPQTVQSFAPKRAYEEMNKEFRDEFIATEAKNPKQYKSAMKAYLYRVNYEKERLGKGLKCSLIKTEGECNTFGTLCKYNKIQSKCESLTPTEKNIRKANFASNARGIFEVYSTNVDIDIIHPDGIRQIDLLSKKLIYLFSKVNSGRLSEDERTTLQAEVVQTRNLLTETLAKEVQYVTHTNKWKFVSSLLTLIVGYIKFTKNNPKIIEYFLKNDVPYFMVIFAGYTGIDVTELTVDQLKSYCEWVVFFIGANSWVTDYSFSEKKLQQSVMDAVGTDYTNFAKKRRSASKMTESFIAVNIQSIMANIRVKMDQEGTVAKIIRLGSPLKFFADFSMSKSGDVIRLFNGLNNVYVDYIENTLISYLSFINTHFGTTLTEDKAYAFYIHFFMMTCIVLIQSFGDVLSKPLIDLINEISRKTGLPLPKIKTVKETIASSKYSGILYKFAIKIFQVIHRIITVKSMGLVIKTFVADTGILEAMDVNTEMEYYATMLFYSISFVAVLRDVDLAKQILDMLVYIPKKIMSIPYIKLILEQIKRTLTTITESMGGFADETDVLQDEIDDIDTFLDQEEIAYQSSEETPGQYDSLVDERLESLGKVSVECGSSGDCFFRCIIVALGQSNTHENALTLRQSVMDSIRSNKQEYDQYIVKGDPYDWNTFEEYVEIMSEPSTYIEGDVEILATARLLGVNIKVYRDSEEADRNLFFTPLAPTTKTIELANYGPNIHYKLVKSKDSEFISDKETVPMAMDTENEFVSVQEPIPMEEENKDVFVSAITPPSSEKDEGICPKDYVFVPASNVCVRRRKAPPKESKRRRL